MTWLIIPLAILAIAANCTMDEIRFHWKRIFAYWFKMPGNGSERWFNPAYSWNNKYQWTKNKYLQWILSSPLVFITDFWHFLKFIMLNSIYGIIIILMDSPIKWWWLIIGMNLAWGFIYEFTSGVYGLLHDRKTFK
jgi:hypothetical protein